MNTTYPNVYECTLIAAAYWRKYKDEHTKNLRSFKFQSELQEYVIKHRLWEKI